MKNQLVNPSIAFFDTYKTNIDKVRTDLFCEIDSVSPEFGNEARKILFEKIESNENRPLLGELFPWFLSDFINGKDEDTHKVSVGWLAAYLYTLFIDEYVDDPKPFSNKKIMAASLLMKTGLLKLGAVVYNTPYFDDFYNSLSLSAHYQAKDINLQKEILGNEVKEEYSSGKNNFLIACACAMSAVNSRHDKFILSFTKNILLSVQYIDDITDYKQDFKEKNYTVLLNDMLLHNPSLANNMEQMSDENLLEELLLTGSLKRVLNKIDSLLDSALECANSLGEDGHQASWAMFTKLKYTIHEFKDYITEHENIYSILPLKAQKEVLKRSEYYIKIVAQST